MRALLIASLIIIPLIVFYALRAVTGEPLSAVVLGLILFVTVASWFGGRPARAGGLKKW
ncbi:MAG TPA: hypothetical protein VIT45_05380 [Allosphingosinicella sp.]